MLGKDAKGCDQRIYGPRHHLAKHRRCYDGTELRIPVSARERSQQPGYRYGDRPVQPTLQLLSGAERGTKASAICQRASDSLQRQRAELCQSLRFFDINAEDHGENQERFRLPR